MSETLSPSRVFAPPLFRPQVMIGAATPLWGYFAGAAMTGVAMWWMSRWMPAAKPPAAVQTALEPASEPPVELAAEPPARPVGGEAAPIPVDAASAVEPSPDVKLLAAPASPRPRKSKDAEAKPH